MCRDPYVIVRTCLLVRARISRVAIKYRLVSEEISLKDEQSPFLSLC